MNKLEYILLIDDSDADNHFHKLIISRSGIKCKLTSISSSHDALELLKNGISAEDSTLAPLPQVVFLDINMPAMNGFELLAKLREVPDLHDRKKDIRIFMLTGSLNPDDRALATEQFADLVTGFRVKPLRENVILDIQQEYFSA